MDRPASTATEVEQRAVMGDFNGENTGCGESAKLSTVKLSTVKLPSPVEDPHGLQSKQQIIEAWNRCFDFLQKEKATHRNWTGELSTSALSTATAISALLQYRKAIQLDEAEHSLAGAEVDRSGGLAPGSVTKPFLFRQQLDEAIRIGCEWLVDHQAADGGFGDTDRSHSNVATSFLVLAAWKMASTANSEDMSAGSGSAPAGDLQEEIPCDVPVDSQFAEPVNRLRDYLLTSGSWGALKARYGRDKTFVVPILSNCALAGIVSWERVPQLPFEAAWLPQDWYRWARMPVVSYAIPALVAIGQARHHFIPTKNPLLRSIRNRAKLPTLEVLRRMQPASGGYLEATPLTSFVLMNLAAVGNHRLSVSQDCVRFLLDSRLPDGSWPIDTNLATWVTSLSVSALASLRGVVGVDACDLRARRSGSDSLGAPPSAVADDRRRSADVVSKVSLDVPPVEEGLSEGVMFDDVARGKGESKSGPEGVAVSPTRAATVSPELVRWLLDCQHRSRHPFTGANPGGWGWTDLSGAVPDADDTPAALLALGRLDMDCPELSRLRHQTLVAAHGGLSWLLRLQNRNGGWPTFCRGWGKLPFDRSGTDLTAHALRAFQLWLPRLDDVNAAACEGDQVARQGVRETELRASIRRGLRFLKHSQRPDGSWLPLWFGNQDRPEEDNPIYGTAKVLMAYADLNLVEENTAQRGILYLFAAQNEDGGWGGGPSTSYHVDLTDPPKKASSSSSVGSTIEETSLVLEALMRCAGETGDNATIMRGLNWLAEAVGDGHLICSWPIGFYFAKLWYHERLYPPIFALGALGAAVRRFKL